MSPTVLKVRGYQFLFFSNEESRIHVHIYCADGEMKVWIEPDVELATSHGLSRKQIREVMGLVKERKDAIKKAWKSHFKT